MGDILDDFLWQRFGPDSYARIDSAVIHPEKVSAVTKFNREQKRFVLLLEKRASSHLIKISSLDAIILFDSNFNLMKDLRTLKKMIVDPQAKPIKLFRLYTSCTLEESVLILATQGKIPEDGIYCSLGRLLLMWGAPNLFDMLKRFHENADSTVEVSSQSHLTDVLHEFCQVLAQNGEDTGPVNLSLISQVKPGDKIYHAQTSSFGKQSIQDTYDDSPQIFWRELFDGKNPKWKYASVTIPGKRKRFQDSMGCAKDPKSGNFEVAKKQRTVADANVPKDLLKNGSEGGTSPREKGGECKVELSLHAHWSSLEQSMSSFPIVSNLLCFTLTSYMLFCSRKCFFCSCFLPTLSFLTKSSLVAPPPPLKSKHRIPAPLILNLLFSIRWRSVYWWKLCLSNVKFLCQVLMFPKMRAENCKNAKGLYILA